MHSLPRLIVSLPVLALFAGSLAAQGLPTTQPGLLSIYIEEVKVGMDEDHATNEAGWPAAYADAGSEDYYLALASMTGSAQVWYLSPYDSHAHEAEAMAATESNSQLSAELARLWRADAQYLNDGRAIRAMARPDLGHGAFPNLAMARYWDITMFRIRPGQDETFNAAIQAYIAAAERAGSETSFRTYQITAGMPWGYYMMFTSVESYADFDQAMAEEEMIMGAATPEEMAALQGFMTTAIQTSITNRFRLDPGMSFVAPETRAADPAFWGTGN